MGRRRGGPTVGERRQVRGVGGEHMDGGKETTIEEAECQWHQIELAHGNTATHTSLVPMEKTRLSCSVQPLTRRRMKARTRPQEWGIHQMESQIVEKCCNKVLGCTHVFSPPMQTTHVHSTLTEKEVSVLPVVGHFSPPLLPPLHRNHVSKEKHIRYGDVGVL